MHCVCENLILTLIEAFSSTNRRVEDLQFRVEEACITKGDLEVKRLIGDNHTFKHKYPYPDLGFSDFACSSSGVAMLKNVHSFLLHLLITFPPLCIQHPKK